MFTEIKYNYFLFPHQTDTENVTVQMSHPGIIIQTVTSEDLSDPLGQSELEGEQELVKEEPSENQNNSGEEEQSDERSNDIQEEKVSSFF